MGLSSRSKEIQAEIEQLEDKLKVEAQQLFVTETILIDKESYTYHMWPGSIHLYDVNGKEMMYIAGDYIHVCGACFAFSDIEAIHKVLQIIQGKGIVQFIDMSVLWADAIEAKAVVVLEHNGKLKDYIVSYSTITGLEASNIPACFHQEVRQQCLTECKAKNKARKYYQHD